MTKTRLQVGRVTPVFDTEGSAVPANAPTTPKTPLPICERLALHKTWRDSHGELNDAPNEAKAIIERLVEALESIHDEANYVVARGSDARSTRILGIAAAALASAGVK